MEGRPICWSGRPRQIIDLRDTDKSWYFAITVFNNCFIIQSPSLFSYFNHFLAAQGSNLTFFSQECSSNYAWGKYYLQQKTFRQYYMHEQTVICRQLFADHVVGSRSMKRKKKMHQMAVLLIICAVSRRRKISPKATWILASFFFCEFVDLDFIRLKKYSPNIQHSWPYIACVAGGISRASAFVLVAKPWTEVAKPWEDWWRVPYFSVRL